MSSLATVNGELPFVSLPVSTLKGYTNYEVASLEVLHLYDKGTTLQWLADDLPWETEVDLDRGILPIEQDPVRRSTSFWASLSKTDQRRWVATSFGWRASQFMHGELGAMMVLSQLTNALPTMEGKFFAASQAYDEARHCATLRRYLNEKVGAIFPISSPLRQLLDDLLADSRWDVKSLGMQAVAEALALAAFHDMEAALKLSGHEPLLLMLVRRIIRDEARHVAFVTMALPNHFKELSDREFGERCEFVGDACVLMQERFTGAEVFEAMDWNPVDIVPRLDDPMADLRRFQDKLFGFVMPTLKRAGLLGSRGKEAGLNDRLEKRGLLQFVNAPLDLEASMGLN